MSSQLALVASPAPPRPPRRRLVLLNPTRASTTSSSSRDQARSGSCLPQPPPRQRLLVAAQSPPPLPSPLAAGAVRADAATGLAFLLFVLAVVISSFLSLAIFSLPAFRALQQLEIAVHKLSKVFAEEVPGTLSSLKLSCLEINDLTSQLKNFRQRLIIDRFGEKTCAEARSQTGSPKQANI